MSRVRGRGVGGGAVGTVNLGNLLAEGEEKSSKRNCVNSFAQVGWDHPRVT